MQWDERMIDSVIYCVGNEVFIYLIVDLPQASTRTGDKADLDRAIEVTRVVKSIRDAQG